MSAVPHQDTDLNAPYDLAAAVTPSDTTALPLASTRGLYIGGGGTVTVIMAADATNSGAGTPVEFAGVPTGTTLKIRVRQVKATGTSATNIVAVY